MHTAYSMAQTDEYWNFRNAALVFKSGVGVMDTTNNNCTTVTIGDCHTSICDTRGNLLFYSNGYNVYDKNNNIMPNGNHFNHSTYGDIYINGNSLYPENKGAIFIPSVNDSNTFYMFYENMEYQESGGGNLLPSKLRYLVVDKSLNGGLGDVVFKDSTLICCDTLLNGNLFATRHGNGSDWWLIVKKYHSTQYYKILIDANGVHTPSIQQLGTPYLSFPTYPCQGDISNNGDKIVYLQTNLNLQGGQLDVLDFDRCTGNLSNAHSETINILNSTDTLDWWITNISPNGKLLYANDGYHMWQMDLTSKNIVSSRTKVGNWDGSFSPNASYFYQMKNGIDSKTYVSCYGGNSFIHVINKPDSFGLTCNFVQKQIFVGTINNGHIGYGSFPNTPNYSLGKSSCSVGIENLNSENVGFNIFPNPTHSSFTINFSNDWNNAAIRVFNVTGQMIVEKQNQNGKQFSIDLSHQSAGIYFVEVQTATTIYRSKVVKQ
jgi:hypothetical protein